MTKKILINEANLFCDWYIKKNYQKKEKYLIKKFKKIKTLNIKFKIKE